MNVLEELKKMKGRYVGNGQTVSLKVDDIIAALENERLNDSTLQGISSTIFSLDCVVDWIKNGCTRGPEAEEVRLNAERLRRLFPTAEQFPPKFGP